MLCVVVKGPSYTDARKQIAASGADMVELRLDEFDSLDFNEIKRLQQAFPLPMIFTLRPASQGGKYAKSEQQRIDELKRLAELEPAFLDVEWSTQHFDLPPKTKKIASFHDFAGTPKNLDAVLGTMRGDYYKIAVTAHNSIDALRLIVWAKQKQNLIAISMGKFGQISRILSPWMGNPITYASLSDDNELGQLAASTLLQKFSHRSLTENSKVCGLIGDPIDKSTSHTFHNDNFRSAHIDAVYVKMNVKPNELAEFITLAKQLPFHGLSVTMPLKEHILSLIDNIDPAAKNIGAVNTLLFQSGKISGCNTDAQGALDVLEKLGRVRNKRVILLGAGGAAKAIAYEAVRRGALLTILNRSAAKATALAERLGADGGGLDLMHACARQGYDILINSTPAFMPIDPDDVLPNTIVMDIKSASHESELVKCAEAKKCTIVHGQEMFREQAKGQYAFWKISIE